jgi:hypothetical protein
MGSHDKSEGRDRIFPLLDLGHRVQQRIYDDILETDYLSKINFGRYSNGYQKGTHKN